MSNWKICSLCGRVGLRGFVVLRGSSDVARGDFQGIEWMCANYKACDRRQEENLR